MRTVDKIMFLIDKITRNKNGNIIKTIKVRTFEIRKTRKMQKPYKNTPKMKKCARTYGI